MASLLTRQLCSAVASVLSSVTQAQFSANCFTCNLSLRGTVMRKSHIGGPSKQGICYSFALRWQCVTTTSEIILSGGTKTDSRPPSFWALVKTCIACLYSNQNIDKTATMLRFAKINCYTGNWHTLVILGLITEKRSMVTFILPGSNTYQARVRCTSCTHLS